MHGIKAVYNRSTKKYDVETVEIEAGDVIAALNSGFLVYDNVNKATECAQKMSHWKPKAREAVITYLNGKINYNSYVESQNG